ncbi:hypothetical protein ILUMI_21015 [Ignelater luminosus]|uniref:Uncharacterized protein n=1 Tax=Ignelater luminosus TaxID=2038154 RepID=A0A8K0CD17_IGNLU|nr:hypothetical protein ILUMI_21015 [Ignelater luminosus]
MEPAHSHIEADTINAAIETAKEKTAADIEVPHDWIYFIRTVRRNSPLQVIEMQQKDFLGYFFDDGEFKRGDLKQGTVRKRQDGMEISFPNPTTLEPLPIADIKVSNLLDLLPYISGYNENPQRLKQLDPEDISDVND